MKGLLLKDLTMMLKYGKITLLACLIFSVAGCLGEPNLYFMLYPVVIGSVMAQSLISYDERSGWDRYCDALPVSRAQVVTGKYLIALIVFAVFFLIGVVGQRISSVRGGGQDIWTVIALLAAGGLIVPAILLPFSFRFGTEKGRIVYLLTVGLVLGGVAALGYVKGSDPSGLNMTSGAAAGLFLAAVVIFIISWRLSIILYKNRELT